MRKSLGGNRSSWTKLPKDHYKARSSQRSRIKDLFHNEDGKERRPISRNLATQPAALSEQSPPKTTSGKKRKNLMNEPGFAEIIDNKSN